MSMAGKARYLFDGFLSMVMAFPQVKLELSKLSAGADTGLWCKAIASYARIAIHRRKLVICFDYLAC